MYDRGQGVPQYRVQALKWCNIGAMSYPASESTQRTAAARKCGVVLKKMSPDEIAEAKKLANAWNSTFPPY